VSSLWGSWGMNDHDINWTTYNYVSTWESRSFDELESSIFLFEHLQIYLYLQNYLGLFIPDSYFSCRSWSLIVCLTAPPQVFYRMKLLPLTLKLDPSSLILKISNPYSHHCHKIRGCCLCKSALSQSILSICGCFEILSSGWIQVHQWMPIALVHFKNLQTSIWLFMQYHYNKDEVV
jgi:hypothetical protein